MPLKSMTDDEIKAALKKVNHDLLALWSENGVKDQVQATLAGAGCTTLSSFQRLGTSDAGITKACKFMGLSEDLGLAEMIMIGSVQAAWEAAKVVHTALLRAQAEKQIMGIAPTLSPNELYQVEKTYERAVGRLPKEEMPGAPFIERMENEMKNGPLTAPRLNEIPLPKRRWRRLLERKWMQRGFR